MVSPDIEDALQEPEPSRDPADSVGRNLEPFLLFELSSAPSYGYNLVQRLKEYGFGRRTTQTSVVYRVLRSLEASGAIRSTWAARESGPSRRYYELTEAGQDLLERRLRQLRRSIDRGERLLQAHQSRFAALRDPHPSPLPGGRGDSLDA